MALLFLERIGKAVRSPARSTLVSYAATEAGIGKSFGLEEALDQIGAVTGPLLTALVIWVLRDDPVLARYQMAFLLLLLPAFLNLAFVLTARRRYPRPEAFEQTRAHDHPHLGNAFHLYMAAAMLLGLGFADWALLTFHASRHELLEPGLFPILYAAAMAVDAIAALIAGTLFDRHGLYVLATTTLISALFAPFVFLVPASWTLCIGSVCWAIGMGAQDSIFKAALVHLVPKDKRGRAYGIFFAFFGLSWWLGSAAMGVLYDHSIIALITFSTITQLSAVPIFVLLARRLAESDSKR